MRDADVAAIVGPIVEGLSLEIDRLKIGSAGSRAVVQIYLDGDGATGSGPSLDDIAQATRAISRALDDAPSIGDAPYVLEVSSRGVTRPLTEPKHFRRNATRLIQAELRDGTSVTGRIVTTTDDAVTLDVVGVEQVLALADLRHAVVQIELNRPLTPAEEAAFAAPDDTDDEE